MADVNPDKTVRLRPDRWKLLVDNYGRDLFGPGDELRVTVSEPVTVAEILFLPAVYRAS